MKTFLLFDDNAPVYYIGKRTEEELRPEAYTGLEVGAIKMLTKTIGIIRTQDSEEGRN